MRISVFIIILSTLLASCGAGSKVEEKDGMVIIHGVIENQKPESVFIQTYKNSREAEKFSSKVDESGHFEIPISNQKLDIVNLFVLNNKKSFIPIIVNKDENIIELKINDGSQIGKQYEVIGSKDSKLVQDFNLIAKGFLEDRKNVEEQMRNLGFEDDTKRKELISEFEQIQNKFVQERDAFIENNASSPAIFATVNYINPNQELEQLKKVRDYLSKSAIGSSHYNDINSYVGSLEMQIAEQKRLENLLKSGTEAPELGFPGVNGEQVSLSSLRGNVVLIDFWASWCKPCRMENPNVVRLYQKYHKSGFEIYSFSLDQQRDRWIQAIQQDGLVWSHHASDLKGWQTAAIPIYGFNSIPFTVLIDKDGKVIDKNLRGALLENKLKEIFGY